MHERIEQLPVEQEHVIRTQLLDEIHRAQSELTTDHARQGKEKLWRLLAEAEGRQLDDVSAEILKILSHSGPEH